ncbi:MAG TPA: response regulator transcription factor [Planctomycetaceae bacterium]|nr:response regulator transcription factor [Planctomycetaceae bacterium]HIQ22138.1 response regulator transcription factor [Planctomycetota bacterium]
MSIRIVIADDQQVVRTGLASMLKGSGIEIVAEATTGEDAIKLAADHQPDVLLLDVRMPECDGLRALGKIRLENTDLPILMLSQYDNPAYVARAVALGANGYLLKDVRRQELIEAIHEVATGRTIWDREQLRKMTGALATPRMFADVEVPLTEREGLVLRLLSEGMTNQQIAAEMDISYETVKEHIQHILRKVGVTDRTQAAVWAVRKGII